MCLYLCEQLSWILPGSSLVRNMRAAIELLSSRPVDLVLSNTHLSDGTGFGLLVALDGLPVTAFVPLLAGRK
jgi:response regulator RpfG family c-di-GMP phosphodiesterase